MFLRSDLFWPVEEFGWDDHACLSPHLGIWHSFFFTQLYPKTGATQRDPEQRGENMEQRRMCGKTRKENQEVR